MALTPDERTMNGERSPDPADDPVEAERRRLVREILKGLRGIRYGSLEIVIHDSKVVHIERREKLRLEK
jgi:hypothetical protein